MWEYIKRWFCYTKKELEEEVVEVKKIINTPVEFPKLYNVMHFEDTENKQGVIRILCSWDKEANVLNNYRLGNFRTEFDEKKGCVVALFDTFSRGCGCVGDIRFRHGYGDIYITLNKDVKATILRDVFSHPSFQTHFYKNANTMGQYTRKMCIYENIHEITSQTEVNKLLMNDLAGLDIEKTDTGVKIWLTDGYRDPY